MAFKKRKIASFVSVASKPEDKSDDGDVTSSLLLSARDTSKRGRPTGVSLGSNQSLKIPKVEFLPEEDASRELRGSAEASFATVDTKGGYGPTKGHGLSHIRKITRIDYNPEICKDYKETGYCGYGDSCIFIHDRSNYKEGWQIEKEWEEKQKRVRERQRRQLEGLSVSSDSDEDSDGGEEGDGEDLPFACFSCRTNWEKLPKGVEPMVTLCGHYFCEKCALAGYREDSACMVCKSATQGVFNVADKILKRMDKQLMEKKKKKQNTIAKGLEGLEGSSDSDSDSGSDSGSDSDSDSISPPE